VEALRKDFILLVTSASGINNKGAIPKIEKVLDIFWELGPTNIGSNETGTILSGVTKEIIRDHFTKVPRIRVVYYSKEKTKEAIRRIRDLGLGLSLAVEGPTDELVEIAHDLGLKPHSVNLSLDVWGKADMLPDEEILEFTTMCGHGLISPLLARDTLDKVRDGKISVEKAVVRLGSPCVCGFFNPERAREMLEKYVQKANADS
jgi:hypothetical protein